MDMPRREFLLSGCVPFAPRILDRAVLGEVHFCRVSDARLLPVARSMFPRSIASCEPRDGFSGITVCGARATVTIDC